MWVFWIHASNTDRIEQGYRLIAERMKIPGHKDPKENIFELVTRWLQDESKGTWLLVLDNLDDDAVLSTPQAATAKTQSGDGISRLQRPLSAYLPQSQNGVILITTRVRSVATKLIEPRNIILVECMTDKDALTLLKKKLDRPVDDADLRELAHILENMPLAITQAAAYIQQKEARYSVRQYIKAFMRNERQKLSLLNYEAGHLRRDPEAKNSIIITWQISFDDIREKWPASADLLSLMSYFDRQGIPKEVLKARSQEEIRNLMKQEADSSKDNDKDIEDSGGSDASGDDMLDEAVDRLRNYSFVSVGEHGRTYEMHSLVQLATRTWLKMHREDERWKAQFCIKLNIMFPTGDHENWSLCKTLFPHAKSAERQRPMEDTSVREWAQILRKAGWYAWARGDYGEAERMCEKSARALRKVLGGEDVETLYSLGMLALTYRDQGRWIEAEKIEVQVMETSRRVLGEEHPSTLTSMANLAVTYQNQGRWTEAEKIEVQVMETSRRVLGEEHPDTLTSMANLAASYQNQGRWTEAEKIEVQVMETRRRVLGEEHPSTLTSMANLAATYRDQGRWIEAEKIKVQVMETSRRVLGEEHPDTLSSMANLAATYQNQGRWTEAEKIEVQVMETSRRVLGEEHPSTLSSMANLAVTYQNQGRWTEAEKIEVQVMETRRRVLGEEHPSTLTSMANLALTMKEQGRIAKATTFMTECVQLRHRVLGPEHPATLSSAATLAEWQGVELLDSF
jgi:Tetratricopeptide repeat/NB-ARC domain